MKALFKDGSDEIYAIIGTGKTDNLGRPVYLTSRDKYPALMDFMPEIVKVQNELTPADIKK